MKIDESKLKTIDLTSLSTNISNQEHKGYFLSEYGSEHYKLLAYFSSIYDNSTLLDIGTNRGCSSLALAYNTTNTVESFDLFDLKELTGYPENITYHIGNVLDESYADIVKTSKVIMLDTYHDGVFENEFYMYLKQIKWSGILLLDDIKLNDEMKEIWNSITEEKYDISDVGHVTGTGLVIFE
jgi:hypothetical protein